MSGHYILYYKHHAEIVRELPHRLCVDGRGHVAGDNPILDIDWIDDESLNDESIIDQLQLNYKEQVQE